MATLLTVGCSDAGHRLGSGKVTGALAPQAYGLCQDGADFELIDDMEDGDGTLLIQADRAGTWFSYTDKTGGTQFPNSNYDTFVMTELSPPVGNSHVAARTYGSGFSDWGAGIGFELFVQKAYDLSRYAGVTFVAKGEPDANPMIRFAVADVGTTPRGRICHDKAAPNPQDPSSPVCDAHYGIDFDLSANFERQTFFWSQLTQQGWAMPPWPVLDLTRAYGMRFQTVFGGSDTVRSFDFWIDDLALICRRD